MTGRIHSIETLGALDGPGLRTVLFLQGCPMRCRYCHNPDTWETAGGTVRDSEELADFCARYRLYYGDTGGVTLSGGEPLLQRDFCGALTQALAARGIGTAIDTGGSVFAPEVLDGAQLTILDIKHTDPVEFERLTGVSQDNLLRTLDHLRRNKLRFWVRQVIVPGWTDDEAQVRTLKQLAEGAEKVELLAYHTMGRQKWETLGLAYALEGVASPSAEQMRRLQALLR